MFELKVKLIIVVYISANTTKSLQKEECAI